MLIFIIFLTVDAYIHDNYAYNHDDDEQRYSNRLDDEHVTKDLSRLNMLAKLRHDYRIRELNALDYYLRDKTELSLFAKKIGGYNFGNNAGNASPVDDSLATGVLTGESLTVSGVGAASSAANALIATGNVSNTDTTTMFSSTDNQALASLSNSSLDSVLPQVTPVAEESVSVSSSRPSGTFGQSMSTQVKYNVLGYLYWNNATSSNMVSEYMVLMCQTIGEWCEIIKAPVW